MKEWLSYRMGLALIIVMTWTSNVADAQESKPKQRQFELTYSGSIEGVPKHAKVKVWIPVPVTNRFQKVENARYEIPFKFEFHNDKEYGNRILYYEANAESAGPMRFSATYDVTRFEAKALSEGKPRELDASSREKFLKPNRLVPTTGRPLELIDQIEFPLGKLDAARMLYDRVDEHVKYDKSSPGYGNGDVLWVCDSRTGNCTDFHSLFISFARSKDIPAYFEIGFPLPPERGEGTIGGYHCWANFFVDERGWIPVDISEADKHKELKEYYFGNLTENRVSFSIGRDVNLEPKQQGPPLNYFIYPYVEVNGEPWPAEKIQKQFSFSDRQQ